MVSIGEDTLEELLRLLDKVPFVGGIRKDLAILRRLLYLRRPPRIAVVGSLQKANELLDRLIEQPASLLAPHTSGWLGVAGAGVRIDWLKLDLEESLPSQELDERPPDAIILLLPANDPEAADVRRALDRASEIVRRLKDRAEGKKAPPSPACFLLVDGAGDEMVGRVSERDLENAERLLERARRLGFSTTELHTTPMNDASLELLSDGLVRALPTEARLEGARALRHATISRRETAKMLVQSSSALAMTVALTPIPFSDLGVLASIQVVTVTGVAYLGGRAWSYRTAAEWMASAGIVGGLGLGLRWTARQLVKLVPGAGSVVSASIAGAGTTALGRSAIAYFIDQRGSSTRAPG